MAKEAPKKVEKTVPDTVTLNERDTAYENFRKSEGIAEGLGITETPAEQAPVEAKEAVISEKKEGPKAEYVAEKKTAEPEEKTVPYGALKEEREKRKELSSKQKVLEDQVRQLIADNKTLMEMVTKPDADLETVTDYDQAIVELRKDNKKLIQELNTIKSTYEKDSATRQSADIEAKVKAVDEELSKEGYPGFYKLVPQVIFEMDQEGITPAERNPEVWKRVYKEAVYPETIGKYIPKQDKKEEKEALKAEANLPSGTGKLETKKKNEDWTFDSYLKMRRENPAFQ